MRLHRPPSLLALAVSALVVALLALAPAGAAQAAKPNPSQARAVPAQSQAQLFVEWGGSWWAAQELHRTKDKSFIHYIGWGAEWDEAVEASRLKRPAGSQAQLFVEWGGSWWSATVLGTERDGRVRIHYDGWGKEWDEAVDPSRLLHLD